MRSVLVDLALERLSERRGDEQLLIALTYSGLSTSDDLAKPDSRMVRVVELQYSAGLTEGAAAEVLSRGKRTVRRMREKARILLADALA